MDNYIIVSGAPLWVCLGLIAVIFICLIILGRSYIKECRENQHYKDKCHKLCRELSILQLNAMSNDVKVGHLPPSRTSRDTSLDDGGFERKVI